MLQQLRSLASRYGLTRTAHLAQSEQEVRVVREALAQGLVTQAHKMLRDIEDDGYIDPSITAQREKIDQLMQQKWIRSELESARIYRSNGEYATAMEKVSEVLNVVPDNAEALAELHQIRQKRLGKALGDARQHLLPGREARLVVRHGPAEAEAVPREGEAGEDRTRGDAADAD